MKVIQRTRREVYQRWISALRSGKYKQERGRLKVTNYHNEVERFCCLGVLCDLASKDGGPEWDGENYMREYSSLPPKIKDWMKLTEFQVYKLIFLNDQDELDFKGIALYIEKHILPKIKD